MGINIGEVDPPSPTPYSTPFESPESGGTGRVSAARIAEVKMWLVSQFHEAGKHVPDFEYTPQSISYLHNVVTLSQAQTEAATIILNDFHQKSAEYRAQGFFIFIFLNCAVCIKFCLLIVILLVSQLQE